MVFGCSTRTVAKVDQVNSVVVKKKVRFNPINNIDIMFVVDNSISMGDEQAFLRRDFPRFLESLTENRALRPNIHVGVISTDVAIGDLEQCEGDDGKLQHGNGDCGFGPEPYLFDVANEESLSRDVNFSGSITDAFSCAADLGVEGCGFEQPLRSMQIALDGNGYNQGFLREDAFLAIVFITDEDDCSSEQELFFSDPTADLSSELGPLKSFRCFEHGVTCGEDDLRSEGLKSSCDALDSSRFMTPISSYVDFLENLKGDLSLVMTAAISGPVNRDVFVSAEVDALGNDFSKVSKTCTTNESDPNAGAVSPYRLARFIDATSPLASPLKSICSNGLEEPLDEIASSFGEVFDACLPGELMDSELSLEGIQPECAVTDASTDGNGTNEVVIPKCELGELPCWFVITNIENCGDFPSELSLELCRGADSDHINCPIGAEVETPLDTVTTIECVGSPK